MLQLNSPASFIWGIVVAIVILFLFNSLLPYIGLEKNFIEILKIIVQAGVFLFIVYCVVGLFRGR